MFGGFSKSVRGASHEKTGLVCQDSSSYKVADHYAVCVVADGHGSKKHFRSNMGSKFAVEATIETIDKFYENREDFEANFPKNHKMIIKNMEKQIISVWNYKVTEHLKANPVTAVERENFTDEEFEKINPESYYGTTLIAAVTGEKFSFGLQIGDGSLVALFDDCNAVMPMEYEESAPANITASICNAGAATMFNSFYAENKKLLAVFASTDGLYTSFGKEQDFLAYHTIITSQICESADFENVVYRNIEKRSHFGTEDDVSLSCVYNKDLIIKHKDDLAAKITAFKKK